MGRTAWRGKEGVRLQAGNTNDMGSGQMKYGLTFDKPVKGLAFEVLKLPQPRSWAPSLPSM